MLGFGFEARVLGLGLEQLRYSETWASITGNSRCIKASYTLRAEVPSNSMVSGIRNH